MAVIKRRPVAAKKSKKVNSQTTAEFRTVDAKSRLLLPKEFASATVTVERIGENELRIRKAVVVPVDELPPLIEEPLKPLSDRARDFILNLLDHPPEPTPAFLKAAKAYPKRRG
jgi:hypothetical protein